MLVARLALAAVLLATAAAHADVTAELSAGAGADSSATDGFAAARASISAISEDDEPPLFERGFVIKPDPDPDADPDQAIGPVRVWVFTGLDPHERASAGAVASAELHANGDAATGLATGRAWFRAYGWGLEARTSVQPVGDLRDRFWRSGRDILQTGGALDVPAMWAIGSERTQFLAFLVHLEIGNRRALPDWGSIGWDREVGVVAARVQNPSFVLDIVPFQYDGFGVAQSHEGTTTYGTTATTADLDIASLTIPLAADVELVARGGVSLRMPVASYVSNPMTTTVYGPSATTGDYWLELHRKVGEETLALGAGSWARLDPSGHAADAGQMVRAEGTWRTGRTRLGAELELGRLVRQVLGNFAPPGLAPAGTKMVMGRGAISAGVRLANDLDVTGTAWLERSDRDDPRWLVPANGELTTHAGGDITARWQFRQL